MKLYLVGEVLDATCNKWIFQGVYSTEEKAISKCVKDNFFLAELELDYDEPIDHREYEYTYYPLLESKPSRDVLK